MSTPLCLFQVRGALAHFILSPAPQKQVPSFWAPGHQPRIDGKRQSEGQSDQRAVAWRATPEQHTPASDRAPRHRRTAGDRADLDVASAWQRGPTNGAGPPAPPGGRDRCGSSRPERRPEGPGNAPSSRAFVRRERGARRREGRARDVRKDHARFATRLGARDGVAPSRRRRRQRVGSPERATARWTTEARVELAAVGEQVDASALGARL